MDIDGSNQAQLTFPGTGYDTGPDWSPDGTKVAWGRATMLATKGNIWTMDPDGLNQVQITTGTRPDKECPVWSPDGAQVVLQGSPDNTAVGVVYVMNADGANLHPVEDLVSDMGCGDGPSWQPLP